MRFDSLKSIAEAIEDPAVKVVSFDVFDTLLLRPTGTEADKFRLLDRRFDELTDAQISFGSLRILAERTLRRRVLGGELGKEDFGLDEIYSVIRDEFFIETDVAERMMQEEAALEEKLCTPRESGRYLFGAAKKAKKRIVLVSDMYLGSEQIAKLLEKNGFTGFETVFVSSERGTRKLTGSLFRDMISCVGTRPEEILHIGDDPENDCRMAEACGMRAALLPATEQTFRQHGCFSQAEKICTDLTDWEMAQREPGISIMRHMAANKYFDDPFRAFDETSDYNADPYFIGYAALGMEIMAVTRWLAACCRRDRIDRIVFLSRDGYLPRMAYRLLRETDPLLPEDAYLYVSRISLLPMMIRQPADFFDLPADITRQTPEKMLRLLDFCVRENGREAMRVFLAERGETEEDFFTQESWQAFMGAFIRRAYDREKHEAARQRITEYLCANGIGGNTERIAVFDMGYSGRITAAVTEASGQTIVPYFFQADGSRSFRSEKKQDSRLWTFFDFSPYMEASMREYAYLEPTASCVGYTEDLQPVFDCGPEKGYSEAAAAMQEGALDMVRDFLHFFAGYEAETAFRYHNAAMPFEAFLRFAGEADRSIYDSVLIDDELWGGRRNIHLKSLMEARLRKMPAYARSEERAAAASALPGEKA